MMEKVVVITGPTAIGKTNISLDIARYYKTEIINADASQLRKGLDIGTAKIDLASVNIKHHLVDIIDILDSFSIKEYQDLAREKISEFKNRSLLPILVGGSGLYINSVIYDYKLNDEGRNIEKEENEYKEYSNEELYQLLKELDCDASINIHPNNRRRVIRAIGRAKSGYKISSSNEGKNLVYDSLIIELTTSREILYDRINKRFMEMIEAGWLDEVKTLMENNIDLNLIKDIGYKELGLFLTGELTFDEAKEEITKQTRNYAKRQLTWFRNKMNTIKVEMDYSNIEKTKLKIINLINDFLK